MGVGLQLRLRAMAEMREFDDWKGINLTPKLFYLCDFG
jgi:hypothetical protein